MSTEGPIAAAKQFTRGTHRLVTPEETVRRALAVAPRAGITRVANITGLDSIGLPVVAVYRPNARSIVVSQGKGLDLMAAKASGLMEAIEGYHAENVRLPLRLASREELLRAGSRVVDTDRLARVSVGTFHNRKRILWCEARDLVSDGSRWLPYEMVHTDFTLPLPTGTGCFTMSSNGLASGNHLLEATSHGLCEVVERDAMALWEMRGGSGSSAGRIDPESVQDPHCRAVLDRLAAAEMVVGLWNITTNVGIAACACVIADEEMNAFGQIYTSHGSGCHPAREVALLRALTEAAQTRLTYIAGARDDGDREFFDRARASTRVERVRRQLEDGLSDEAVDFGDVPRRIAGSFDEDLEWELERLAAVGVTEVLVVDLSHVELELPVVRVVVPGLEGLVDAPGYVPGPRAQAERDANR